MKHSELIEQLGISPKTFGRWLEALGIPKSPEYGSEEVQALYAIQQELNKVPRVTLRAAAASVLGIEDEQNESQSEEMSLGDRALQRYAGAMVAAAPSIAKKAVQLLDIAVLGELDRQFSLPTGKGGNIVERGLKKAFSSKTNNHQVLALLPGYIDVDEDLLEAEFVED